MNFFSLFLVFILAGFSNSESAGKSNCWNIARLKYEGGGDWYASPSALPNLKNFAKKQFKIPFCSEDESVSLLSPNVFQFPILFMTGHGNVYWKLEERQVLKEYLTHGGMLWVDDNYGLNKSFREQLKLLFPKHSLSELSWSHSIFNSYFKFPKGLPKIHKHDGKRPQLFGMEIDQKIAVLYVYEADLTNGWENQDVYNHPMEKRNQALKMGANIIQWYLQGQSVQ